MKVLLFLLCSVVPLFACTDFVVQTVDGRAVVGRSMEWGEPFDTEIQIIPRGQTIRSQNKKDAPPFTWTSGYGYLCLMTKPNVFFDGFNEKGLSIGALWFPSGEYPKPNPSDPKPLVSFLDVPFLLLGNCATVEEVKQLLPMIDVYAFVVPMFNGIPVNHLSIHDASGRSIVIEYIDGKLNIFDNPVGVLTNDPSFPWQLTNLKNYMNLTSINVSPHQLGKLELTPTGQGSGMLGLPGDWTPPARFVKMAFVKNLISAPNSSKEGVILSFHLLNMVDIPSGGVTVGGVPGDYTQWAVVKDLQNLELHLRTYEDMQVQTVKLKSYNLSKTAKPQTIQIPAWEVAK